MELIERSIHGFLKFHLITIGIQNDIFKHLSSSTSFEALAKHVQCDKRYVKEWCQGNSIATSSFSSRNCLSD